MLCAADGHVPSIPKDDPGCAPLTTTLDKGDGGAGPRRKSEANFLTRGGGQGRSAGEVDPSSFYSGGLSEATTWRLLLHEEVRPKVNLSQKTNVFTVMQTSLNFSGNQTKQNPSVTPLWATTIKLKFAVGRVASGKGWRLRRRGAGGFHGMEFWCMLTRASVRVCAQERAGACVRA